MNQYYGLMRVRGPIHQNDAHIFCTEEQAEEEFQRVMDLHRYYYKALGITDKDYYLSFAIRDEKNKKKYLGEDAIWKKAQKIALKYIKKTNIPYQIEMGEAAFYGSKIDFNIRTVTGKVFSASTNQLDFFLPRAFSLKYTDKDGKKNSRMHSSRATGRSCQIHCFFNRALCRQFSGLALALTNKDYPDYRPPLKICPRSKTGAGQNWCAR